MALNLKLLAALLQQPESVQVLHNVATTSATSLNELIHDTSLSQEQVLSAIETLKKNQLIKATQSPIPSLATFYITATGLQADRELGDLT